MLHTSYLGIIVFLNKGITPYTLSLIAKTFHVKSLLNTSIYRYAPSNAIDQNLLLKAKFEQYYENWFTKLNHFSPRITPRAKSENALVVMISK